MASLAATHDANGNLTGMPQTAATMPQPARTYVWDEVNRLISATDGITELASYSYDGEGRRTTRTLDPTGAPTVQEFLYDGYRLIADYDGADGKLLRRFVHGPGVDEPQGSSEPTDRHCPH